MTIQISCGNKDILCSGSFITFRGEESRMHIRHRGEELVLRLAFVDEPGKHAGMRRQMDVISESEGKFTFYNYSAPQGIYPTEPLSIGSIGGRELWFQYRIDDFNNSASKLVIYTFYIGKEINNGED